MSYNKRILYIEENPNNMRLMRKFLQMGGYEIIEADTVERGIDTARSDYPDLILMDISLPEGNGIEVTRQLKQYREIAHIPVIALTANEKISDRGCYLDYGCDDYMPKPISINQLLEKISVYI